MDAAQKYPYRIIKTALGTMAQGAFIEKVKWPARKKVFFAEVWRESPHLSVEEVLRMWGMHAHPLFDDFASPEPKKQPAPEKKPIPKITKKDAELPDLPGIDSLKQAFSITETFRFEPGEIEIPKQKQQATDTTEDGEQAFSLPEMASNESKKHFDITDTFHFEPGEIEIPGPEGKPKEKSKEKPFSFTESQTVGVYREDDDEEPLPLVMEESGETHESAENDREDMSPMGQAQAKGGDLTIPDFLMEVSADQLNIDHSSLGKTFLTPEEDGPKVPELPSLDIEGMTPSKKASVPPKVPATPRTSLDVTDFLQKASDGLEDQVLLFKIVLREKKAKTRRHALAKITNQRLLDRIIFTIEDDFLLSLALQNLTHPGLIVDHIWYIEVHGLSAQMIPRVSDQKLLSELAMHIDKDIREIAQGQIKEKKLTEKIKDKVRIDCARCKNTAIIPVSMIGNQIRCSRCSHEFRVPQSVRCAQCGSKQLDAEIFCKCGEML